MTRGGRRDNPGGRPPKDPTAGPAKMASYRLSPAVIEAIRDGAARLGVSQADLIAAAVTRYLDQQGPASAAGAPEPGESSQP